jgi:hypothetical protein
MRIGVKSVSSRVVYTALFGGYEQLVEQDAAAMDPECDLVCITDREDLTSSTWNVVKVPSPFPDDPVRSARGVKLTGHPALGKPTETLWIDNRVVLKESPSDLLRDWLASSDWALPLHDHRETVRDEFVEILRNGFDSPQRVRAQLAAYTKYSPATLAEPPLWTAIMARRITSEVERVGLTWMYEVLRHSRRDQLSANMALSQGCGISINRVALPNRESDLHRWLTVDELPKDRAIRYWNGGGDSYSLAKHAYDVWSGNRVIRHLAWRARTYLAGHRVK